jgi:hypothetical protein
MSVCGLPRRSLGEEGSVANYCLILSGSVVSCQLFDFRNGQPTINNQRLTPSCLTLTDNNKMRIVFTNYHTN